MRRPSPVWSERPRAEPGSIRLVLGHGPRMFREAIRVLLQLDPEIQVVGEGGSAAEVVALALAHEPDVVLVDVDLDGGGVAAARAILAAGLECRCLLVAPAGGRRTGRRAQCRPWFVLDDTTAVSLAAAVRARAGDQA